MLIETLSERNYKAFHRCIEFIKESGSDRRIVIYGAGVMGVQFLYVLKALLKIETLNVCFCDSNEKKWGLKYENVQIISPNELTKDDIIILSMERYEIVYERLSSIFPPQNLVVLTNRDEIECYEEFRSNNMDAETLILGDCELNKIAYKDKNKDKKSIESILQKEHIKIVGCNGIYVRQHYVMASILADKMPNLKKVFLVIDIRNFHSMYHLYRKNQHVKLFEGILEGKNRDFFRVLEERMENGITFENINTLNANHKKKDVIAEQILDMKAFYMYRLSKENESIDYLSMLSDMMGSRNVQFKLILLPVNFERGMRLSDGRFVESLNEKVELIRGIIGNDNVIDLSCTVSEKEYVGDHLLGDGYVYKARKRVAEDIKRLI